MMANAILAPTKNLIPDPFCLTSAYIKCIDETDGNGGEHRPNRHDLLGAASFHDDGTPRQGEYGGCQDQR